MPIKHFVPLDRAGTRRQIAHFQSFAQMLLLLAERSNELAALYERAARYVSSEQPYETELPKLITAKARAIRRFSADFGRWSGQLENDWDFLMSFKEKSLGDFVDVGPLEFALPVDLESFLTEPVKDEDLLDG